MTKLVPSKAFFLAYHDNQKQKDSFSEQLRNYRERLISAKTEEETIKSINGIVGAIKILTQLSDTDTIFIEAVGNVNGWNYTDFLEAYTAFIESTK